MIHTSSNHSARAGIPSACCESAKREPSQVEGQLIRLGEARMAFARLVGEINDKVGPVLLPPLADKDGCGGMPPEPMLCPLATQLRDAVNDIQSTMGILDSIRRRIAL